MYVQGKKEKKETLTACGFRADEALYRRKARKQSGNRMEVYDSSSSIDDE